MFQAPMSDATYIDPRDHVRLADLINDCVNCALRFELRKYFLSPSGYDEIEPVDEPMENARISQRELDKLNIPLIMSLFEECEVDPYCPEQRLDGTDAGGIESFLAAKFLQLVKIVKDKKLYYPDLFGQLIIELMSYKGDPSDDSGFQHEEKLKELFHAAYAEDFPGFSVSGFFGDRFLNLWGLVDTDFDLDTGYFFDPIEYMYLYDDPDGSKFLRALKNKKDKYSPYTKEYLINMYKSVGYATPLLMDHLIREAFPSSGKSDIRYDMPSAGVQRTGKSKKWGQGRSRF